MNPPNQRPPNMHRSTLRLIHRHQHRQRPDPKARDQPPRRNLLPDILRRDLDDDPDAEHQRPDRHAHLPPQHIRDGGGH